MKILIEMSPEHYDGLLEKCAHWLPEYSILKNGVIVHRQVEGKERRMIAILCRELQAYTLLHAARTLYSPAADDIKRALDPLRDL